MHHNRHHNYAGMEAGMIKKKIKHHSWLSLRSLLAALPSVVVRAIVPIISSEDLATTWLPLPVKEGERVNCVAIWYANSSFCCLGGRQQTTKRRVRENKSSSKCSNAPDSMFVSECRKFLAKAHYACNSSNKGEAESICLCIRVLSMYYYMH